MQGVPFQILFSQYYTLPLSFRAKGQEAGSVVRISIDQNSKQCEELLTLAWLSKSKCRSGAGGVTTDYDLPRCPFSLPQKSTAVAVIATLPRSQELKPHRSSIPWIRMQRNFRQPEKLGCIVKHMELKGNFQLPQFLCISMSLYGSNI